MIPQEILITGGAGFVGSNLAIHFKKDKPSIKVKVIDNLYRRGSELSLQRLQRHGVDFYHGDIRIVEDISKAGPFDLLIECSAEPSVQAGYHQSPVYLNQTNLVGTLNCLEAVRCQKAAILFLSTSRVYPIKSICNLNYHNNDTRFIIGDNPNVNGVSQKGISEEFNVTGGVRSLYGATKLCSELMIQEYLSAYNLKGVINRCGVLTGPWQMGKVDQGFVVLWVARHFWCGELSYMGYGGHGKQVRDILHIDDLYRLLCLQIAKLNTISGDTFNVGGGLETSLSLCELTRLCRIITGNDIDIHSIAETSPGDIPYYVSDTSKINAITGWKPLIGINEIVSDIYTWIRNYEKQLEPILG